MAKATATMTQATPDTAVEAVNQEEYNHFLTEAPIEDFAQYAGISLDEAVNRRIEAARQTVDLSQVDVNVRLLTQPQGKMLGLATVSYNGFHMDGYKIFNGDNGLFIGEPTIRDERTGNFVKSIRVSGEDLRQALNEKALQGYNLAVEKLVARAAEATKTAVKPAEQRPPSYRTQYRRAAHEAAKHNAALPEAVKGDKAKTAERG
jgi:DNA-binding cell septation regulator SpoVG